MPFLPPVSVTPVRVALVSNITNDRREVEIRDSSPVTIGRASRSKGKNLEAQTHNALFDCPVVSRIHAEIRMVPAKSVGQPHLTIADSASLHGTKVNGMPLMPGSPVTLQTGDVIKLGERVTRGDDAHEGVSLTFHRLSTPPSSYMSSTANIVPASTQRGFRAPSFSDASEVDSDHDVSDGEHHPSSAKTTPEQSKMKLGSQNAPITLDTDVASFDEDITFSRRVPESSYRPAIISSQPNVTSQAEDFDSFSDVASEQDVGDNEDYSGLSAGGLSTQDDLCGGIDADSDEESSIDHDADGEYGCEHDDADDMSNPAPNLSSEEDSEVDDEEPARREPSVELGIFDDTTVRQPAAFSDLLDAAAWAAPASKQYDHVRSSLPVVEQAPTLAPHCPTGRTTITSLTYGYPSYNRYADTDFTPSGHWDVQHPMVANYYRYQTVNSDFSFEAQRPQPSFPMSIDAIVEPPLQVEGLQVDAEQISTTADDTVDQTKTTAEPTQEVSTRPSMIDEAEADPSNAAESSSKRKRDDVDDTADIPRPSTNRRRLTPTTKAHSAIRRAVVGVTQATACAAVGALGTVAFLSSPMAESLIQWLG